MRREAKGIAVPVAPRERFDVIGIAQPCPQDGAVADARPDLTGASIEEGGGGWPVAKGFSPNTRR
jgi:hypothetical protein